MRNRFYSKDLGVLLNDLKQAAPLPYEAVLVKTIEDRMNSEDTAGKLVLRYDSQPVPVKPLLEELLVSLLLQREQGLSIQLHVSPESTSVQADPFFLKEILRLIFQYLADQLSDEVVSIYLTRGEEKCIIEIETAAAVSTKLSASVITLCQKLLQDMSSELIYTGGGDAGAYFGLKLVLAA